MFGPIRAVLVDDMPRHLIAISTGLASAKIPCTPYWYDRNELAPSKKLKPSPPEDGHPYVRIIFTDLNLEENTTSDIANVIAPAISVIKRLVGNNPGPYIVVFWTVMSFDIADIRAELISRLQSNDVPLPVAVDEISKGSFIDADITEKKGDTVLETLFTTLHGRGEELRQEVESVIRKHGLVGMLAEWESRAFCAAGDAVGHIQTTALRGQLPGEDLPDTISKIVALISREAVGAPNASDSPAQAFDAAMLDVLIDAFGGTVDDQDYMAQVRSVLTPDRFENIELADPDRVNAALNTIWHLDTKPKSSDVIQRGQIVRLDDAIKAGFAIERKEVCCWGDFFCDPKKDDPSGSLLTKVSEPTIRRFREIVKNLSQAADGVIPKALVTCRQERNKELKARYDGLKAGKSEFEQSIEWILVEAGAACDHSQRKNRTIRYLVGAIVPVGSAQDYMFSGSNHKLANEASRFLGPFELGGAMVYLLISLKRFVVWQKPDQSVPPAPYLRLRTSTVDYLLSCYATWSTRPGIVEFS